MKDIKNVLKWKEKGKSVEEIAELTNLPVNIVCGICGGNFNVDNIPCVYNANRCIGYHNQCCTILIDTYFTDSFGNRKKCPFFKSKDDIKLSEIKRMRSKKMSWKDIQRLPGYADAYLFCKQNGLEI